MVRVPLRETAVITLNSSGAGTAKVGPLSGREKWYPSRITVNTHENVIVNEAQCNIYIGPYAQITYIRDSTYRGSSGDFTEKGNNDIVTTGMYVWAVWTVGDANAQAMLTVEGTKEI